MAIPFCTVDDAFSSFMDNPISVISPSIPPKQSRLSDYWGDIDSFCTKYGFYEDHVRTNRHRHHHQQHQIFSASDAQFQQANSATTFKNIVNGPDTTSTNISGNDHRKLSTEQILKLAGERFVHFSSQKFININMSMHPYGSSLSDLSAGDKQDVELAQLLLAAAEKVGNGQSDRAVRLLQNCQWISSKVGTPVQRVVFYFADALVARINNAEETSSDKKPEDDVVDVCLKRKTLALLAMHQQLPFFQVVHYTAVQTILENININKSKIHLIDFHILTGIHWAALMQAVTNQTRDQNGYLKITAIEAVDRDSAERTGKHLRSFATYLNLPFSYNVVFLTDFQNLRQEDMGIDPEEDVAVLFPFVLRTLISRPICLKNLITITRKIKPSIVVVGEVEANHNSPSFATRFIDALFFYGVLFDSLEESMAGNERNRMEIEGGTFREGIRNIVAAEGYRRLTRSVTINVWRAFLARFGMQELELSSASLYQASLIVNQFASGKSCTLDVGTKCLLVGWKGTPLFSLSAWKFH